MKKLSALWGRIQNTPGIKRDVAIVVALLVVGSLTTLYFFAKYDVVSPTADTYEFSAEFDQAPAVQLAGRQEVRIAGISVGKITDADVTDEGAARLTFKIDPDQTVYTNARLVLRSKTPLNVIYVALDPGGPPAAPLDEGGTIPMAQTERVLQPYELLDELDARARTALTDLVMQADVALADAPANLPDGVKSLDGAASSFEPVIRALHERRANLEHLVTAIAQISQATGDDDARLTSLADSLATTLGVLARNDKQVGETVASLPGVTRTLRESMRNSAQLSRLLSPTLVALNEASGDLPDALADLDDTVVNAHGLLTSTQPVVRKLRPVVADLRPLVTDVRLSLGDLSPVVSTLPDATQRLVPWLDHLGAFIYNTSSSFSLGDVNGGLGRAHVVLKLTDPTGGGLG